VGSEHLAGYRTYLILDFPAGIGAMVGIEVPDRVARKECASIFDVKQGANSRHPGTELTPRVCKESSSVQ
jgi:hypothetical protein